MSQSEIEEWDTHKALYLSLTMSKLYFSIILLIGLGAWWFRPVPAPAPLPSHSPPLQSFGQYRFAAFAINDLKRLQLFSNLEQKLGSAELIKINSCSFLVNAGFYDEQNQHLGWFQVNGRELSRRRESRLFDGFLSIVAGRAAIDFSPAPAADYGVQSGPVLVHQGQPLKLKLKDDQLRRRIVAAINSDDQLIFMVILSPQSDYAGPLLTDLPEVVLAINPNIVSAINLDGGSASAFIDPELSLKEYQRLGGYFCYN